MEEKKTLVGDEVKGTAVKCQNIPTAVQGGSSSLAEEASENSHSKGSYGSI